MALEGGEAIAGWPPGLQATGEEDTLLTSSLEASPTSPCHLHACATFCSPSRSECLWILGGS